MSDRTLVMTLLARNEADIIDAQLAFHLSAGVDFIVATDNRRTTARTRSSSARSARVVSTSFASRRRHAPGGVGHAHGAPRGDRAGCRLGHQLRRGRVLVAAWRHAEGGLRDDSGAVRRRAGMLAALPASTRGRAVLRGADDRPSLQAGVLGRQADDLPRTSEGRASRRRGRRDRGRESQRRAGTGLEPFRAWHPIEVLHFSLRSASTAEEQESWRIGSSRPTTIPRSTECAYAARAAERARCASTPRRSSTTRRRARTRGRQARGRHEAARRAPGVARPRRGASTSHPRRLQPACRSRLPTSASRQRSRRKPRLSSRSTAMVRAEAPCRCARGRLESLETTDVREGRRSREGSQRPT